MGWSMGVPLCDDLWLGMQLRNIALVDLGVIRNIEAEALEEYFRTERTPTQILMVLSGLSQMWIFSLYEFLRTWRQKAKHIIATAKEYETVAPRKKAKFLKTIIATAEGRHRFVRIAPTFYTHQLKQISNPEFVRRVQDYFDETSGLFSEVSAIRMALAKHEVEGKQGFAAEAPGYGRMSYFTGSIYWHYAHKLGFTDKVDRREIANAFLGITGEMTRPEQEDEDDSPPE